MNLMDAKDALRALRWRIRQLYCRCKGLLSSSINIQALISDPESCNSMYNLIVLGVAEHASADLPAQFTVTPSNILQFLEILQEVGFKLQTPARNDAREAWRRFSKCVLKNPHIPDTQVSSRRHKCFLRISLVDGNPNQVIFQVAEGEFIPHPEHVEAQLGIEPSKPFKATGAELFQFVSAKLAHNRPAQPDQPPHNGNDR